MVSLVGRSPANAGVSVPGMVSFVLTPVDSVWRPRIFSDLSRRGSPPARFVIERSGSAHHIGALASLGSRETMYAIVKTGGKQYRVAKDDVIRVERLPGEAGRSEEHTSELQSLMRISYAVFCLKKKNK